MMKCDLLATDGYGEAQAVSTGSGVGVATTYHPELAILRAVSTVPPRTTSFMPSIMEEPPPPPTRGWTSDLRASMAVYRGTKWY